MTLHNGHYYIYATNALDEEWALTYNGVNQDVTITHYHSINRHSSQKWIITRYDSTTFTVSPANAPNLQVGWGSGNVAVVLPAHNYTWTISTDNGQGNWTIQDGNCTVYWHLKHPDPSKQVHITSGNNSKGTSFTIKSTA